jgi:hypothetical protein
MNITDSENVPRLNYTSKDFSTLRQELIARIPLLCKNWSDLNESDPGITIVELFSAMSDILMFNLDMASNEAQFLTAVQRKSVINLAALIDYFPNSVTSSRAQIYFDGTKHFSVGGASLVIPAYTQVSTSVNNGVNFVTTTVAQDGIDPLPVDVLLTNNKRTALLNAIQGTRGSDTFRSDGTPDQKYQLSGSGIDSTTVLLRVNDTLWTSQNTFINTEINSEIYVTAVDDKGNVFVTFGDGQFGKIPESNSVIEIDYVISDGETGTVGFGTVTKILDRLLDVNSAVVTDMAVVNPRPSTAGTAPEPIERTKLLAPASLSALFTAKTKNDYEALVLRASSTITKVNVWGEQEEIPPYYPLLNKVQIVFSGRDSKGDILDQLNEEYPILRSITKDYLEPRKIITTRNAFIPPVNVHIKIKGIVAVDLTRYDGPSVLCDVKANLASAFGFDVVDFGQDIHKSQIQRVIDSTPGVAWSDICLVGLPALAPIPAPAPVPIPVPIPVPPPSTTHLIYGRQPVWEMKLINGYTLSISGGLQNIPKLTPGDTVAVTRMTLLGFGPGSWVIDGTTYTATETGYVSNLLNQTLPQTQNVILSPPGTVSLGSSVNYFKLGDSGSSNDFDLAYHLPGTGWGRPDGPYTTHTIRIVIYVNQLPDGTTLQSGEVAWAAVCQGAASIPFTVIGEKGTNPAKPNAPAGSILLGYCQYRSEVESWVGLTGIPSSSVLTSLGYDTFGATWASLQTPTQGTQIWMDNFEDRRVFGQ